MLVAVLLGIFCIMIDQTVSVPPQSEEDDSEEVGRHSAKLIVKLNPVDIVKQIVGLAEENDINISKIFMSRFFNSRFFNPDFLKVDFFFSDFINSDILSRSNFRKLKSALFGQDNGGSFNAEVAEMIQEFFVRRDKEGLKNYLNSLPDAEQMGWDDSS